MTSIYDHQYALGRFTLIIFRINTCYDIILAPYLGDSIKKNA